MLKVSDEQFDEMISRAMDALPQTHMDAVRNVAIVYEDEPSDVQRDALELKCHETLFGLYEGVPLTQRQGAINGYPPDKITIFKNPLLQYARDMDELERQVLHTLWHEIAHYFGLDHEHIHELERRRGLNP